MTFTLLPQPRHLMQHDGSFAPPAQGLIVIEAERPAELRFTAERLRRAVAERRGLAWELQAAGAAPLPGVVVTLRLRPEVHGRPESYAMSLIHI